MVIGQFMTINFVRKPLPFQSQNGLSLTQPCGTWLSLVKGPLPQVMTKGSTGPLSTHQPASTHLTEPHHLPKSHQSVWNGTTVLRQDVRIPAATTPISVTGVHTSPKEFSKRHKAIFCPNREKVHQ